MGLREHSEALSYYHQTVVKFTALLAFEGKYGTFVCYTYFWPFLLANNFIIHEVLMPDLRWVDVLCMWPYKRFASMKYDRAEKTIKLNAADWGKLPFDIFLCDNYIFSRHCSPNKTKFHKKNISTRSSLHRFFSSCAASTNHSHSENSLSFLYLLNTSVQTFLKYE